MLLVLEKIAHSPLLKSHVTFAALGLLWIICRKQRDFQFAATDHTILQMIVRSKIQQEPIVVKHTNGISRFLFVPDQCTNLE
jgi:hypothetical protein